jgi:hypothetical protein
VGQRGQNKRETNRCPILLGHVPQGLLQFVIEFLLLLFDMRRDGAAGVP